MRRTLNPMLLLPLMCYSHPRTVAQEGRCPATLGDNHHHAVHKRHVGGLHEVARNKAHSEACPDRSTLIGAALDALCRELVATAAEAAGLAHQRRARINAVEQAVAKGVARLGASLAGALQRGRLGGVAALVHEAL